MNIKCYSSLLTYFKLIIVNIVSVVADTSLMNHANDIANINGKSQKSICIEAIDLTSRR